MRRKGAERDSIYMVVAKNIKYYRKSRNMTQAQLAEKTEYSHEFIRRIEVPNSRKNFSLDTVSNITFIASKYAHITVRGVRISWEKLVSS